MDPQVAEILNRPMSQYPEVPVMPEGGYHVRFLQADVQKTDDGKDFLGVQLRFESPMQNVNVAELQKIQNWNTMTHTDRIFLNNSFAYDRIKRLMTAAGFNENQTLPEILPQLAGRQALAEVRHDKKQGDRPWLRLIYSKIEGQPQQQQMGQQPPQGQQPQQAGGWPQQGQPQQQPQMGQPPQPQQQAGGWPQGPQQAPQQAPQAAPQQHGGGWPQGPQQGQQPDQPPLQAPQQQQQAPQQGQQAQPNGPAWNPPQGGGWPQS